MAEFKPPNIGRVGNEFAVFFAGNRVSPPYPPLNTYKMAEQWIERHADDFVDPVRVDA